MSVNPYQYVQVQLDENAPHLKNLGDAVFKGVVSFSHEDGFVLGRQATQGESPKQDSSIIIITGESGTGKTEATKILFDHLLRLSGSCEQDSRKVSPSEERCT